MRTTGKKDYFGEFGGRFIPETLEYPLRKLEEAYLKYSKEEDFQNRLNYYLRVYAGRPTPLYFARKLSNKLKLRIYLKREDLLHTGAHKINNALGQALLALKMGKDRIIAETGAGQHGVATATVSALFSKKCDVYMGKVDIQRQRMNVFRMKLLGARVVEVLSGSQTLKDACNEALRDWVTNVRDTYYLLGSTVGPYPYPLMVRDFQAVICRESKKQILKAEGELPDYLIACVGGGSNSLGLFHPFFKDKQTRFIGVEAKGKGYLHSHASSLIKGRAGILHGSKSYVLQDKFGQIEEAYSIAPGLDYPGVGPEHSYYKRIKRARYVGITDKEAFAGFKMLSELEGIIPALEPAHAIYYLKKLSKTARKNSVVVLCLSGRGDKDLDIVMGAKNSEVSEGESVK